VAKPFLSKTRYMNGLQCAKLLWLVCNDREKVPEPDAATLHIFDQGHLVGELAKKLYPGGVNIPHEDFRENLKRTRESLGQRRPLFEPGFMTGGIFSRLDILNPVGLDAWDIIEVKSSTIVKEENYDDVSFQKLCVEKCGLTINKCYLAHINNQYIRNGEIDPEQLFVVEDITAAVEEASRGIDERIQPMLETISLLACPDLSVGSHCRSPYECSVTYCWEALPENNIFCLYYGGKKCFELLEAGIYQIKDIPANYKLNRTQQIQKECDLRGMHHIEKQAIKDFLATLQSPVHYLDFETVNPAVPLWDGTRPYQQVPFQFSLHVTGDSGDTRHYSFLAEGTNDPRPEFLRHLNESIGNYGSIVTYNQSFEKGIIDALSAAFPEYQIWLDSLQDRIIDLITPFKGFSYYNPVQNGSASLKSVLPALTGKSYEGMPINEGGAASRAYLDMTFGDVTPEQKQQIRIDLEQYCGLDTEAMVWIVQKLTEISS
jgi:Domain of unknown function(DUF2779)